MGTDKFTKKYNLSKVEYGGLGNEQDIPDSIQEDLLTKQTTKEHQQFLKDCHMNNKWITCSCADNALLSVRKTVNFYSLVRLTSRGKHAEDCSISVENLPIPDKKIVDRPVSYTHLTLPTILLV